MSTPSLSQYQAEISQRMAQQDWAGAGAAAEGCRAAHPESVLGWLMGSFIALATDRPTDALTLADAAARLDGEQIQVVLQQAECLWALGRAADARLAADRALELGRKKHDAAALEAVAAFHMHRRDAKAAVAAFDAAMAVEPSRVSLWTGRAATRAALGEFAAAGADLEEALRLAPADADTLALLAELGTDLPNARPTQELEALLAQNPGQPEHAVPLRFALAQSYDRLNATSDSFRHLLAANALERTRLRYNPQLDRDTVDALIERFAATEPLHPSGSSEQPIFIVGLPRSGTTLVERILSGHSAVASVGEVPAFPEAVGAQLLRHFGATRPDFKTYIGAQSLLEGDRLADDYLRRVAPWRNDAARFVDKTTINFYYCALILRAFPKARIVHVTRHPMASGYALFRAWFRGAFPFCYHLGELGDFYVGYRRLMTQWERILPGRLIPVSYEALVREPEPQIRALLDAVGLPFEAACLEPHQLPDAVATASYQQVRRPINDASVDAWRRYAEDLAPYAERLAAAGIAID